MGDSSQPLWLADVQEHNFPAAESYLNLVFSSKRAARVIASLRDAPITEFKAKDIFRASQLSLLGVSNLHVERDREKIREGTKLSPVLLVRDPRNRKVIVADGYHRLCAVYALDEDALVPCKIV